MQIRLSDHFTYRKLLRFTAPSIAMMIFTSIYGVVDGFFVSNFVGKTPFAAVNFIMPFLMILSAVGFMLGTGGSALVAKTMGEGNEKKAERLFSLFIYTTLVGGVIFAILGMLTVRPIAILLGAEGEMIEDCVLYTRIVLCALPLYMAQYAFQSFYPTAEKPQLGLYVSIGAGCTNILLDALFVAVFSFGLAGAAVATAISQAIGGLIPLIYFARPNTSLLRLGRTSFDLRALLMGSYNGMSELLSNISMSVVGMLYNVQLMAYAGEDGVAAYGVMMYVSMIFCAAFIGYAVGTAPVIAYHYGAGNTAELSGVRKKSLRLILACSVLMLGASLALARPLSLLFVGYDEGLTALTVHGFRIFSVSFLFSGIAIFGSSFFTALNDGLTSALLSSLRTLVLQIAAVLLLPIWFATDGIWYSLVVAELLAAVLTFVFMAINRKKYQY